MAKRDRHQAKTQAKQAAAVAKVKGKGKGGKGGGKGGKGGRGKDKNGKGTKTGKVVLDWGLIVTLDVKNGGRQRTTDMLDRRFAGLRPEAGPRRP